MNWNGAEWLMKDESGWRWVNVNRERRKDTDWGGVSATGNDRPWIGQVMSEGCRMAALEIEP